jgi:predicted nucleic acid-binding protein
VARYLLDTDVLIDLSKGREPARSVIPAMTAAGDRFGICAVQLAEFYAGEPRGRQPLIDALLDALPLWPISRDAAFRAGAYRRQFTLLGVTILTPDALNAAVAWAMGATILTGNVRDYPMADVRARSL